MALQDNECPICYEAFDEKERRQVHLPCTHFFCRTCTDTLIKGRKTFECQMCRTVHNCDVAKDPEVLYAEKYDWLFNRVMDIHTMQPGQGKVNAVNRFLDDVGYYQRNVIFLEEQSAAELRQAVMYVYDEIAQLTRMLEIEAQQRQQLQQQQLQQLRQLQQQQQLLQNENQEGEEAQAQDQDDDPMGLEAEDDEDMDTDDEDAIVIEDMLEETIGMVVAIEQSEKVLQPAKEIAAVSADFEAVSDETAAVAVKGAIEHVVNGVTAEKMAMQNDVELD